MNQPSHPAANRKFGGFAPRALAAICLAALFRPDSAALAADEPPLGQITPNFRVLGELRGRSESVDFFQPELNPAKGVLGNQNDYSFGALRARLGLAMNTP